MNKTVRSSIPCFQNTFSSCISEIFSSHKIEYLAKSLSLVQRKRKLNATAFFQLCCSWDGHKIFPSLEQQCLWLYREHGIEISKQSLDHWFDRSAVSLMETVLQKIMQVKLTAGLDLEIRKWFSRLLVLDSTIEQLSNKCKDRFRGFGGGATHSGVKFQYGYDLFSGNPWHLIPRQATQPDNNFYPQSIPGNSLLLFDLGYFSDAFLEQIANAKAYYLCRLKFRTSIYVLKAGEMKKLCLPKLIRRMKVGEIREIKIYLGENSRTPMRLILEKLPKKVADKIRHKIKTDKQNKRKGISQSRLEYCNVNAYITNVDEEKLSLENARMIYSLRWQIEIVFKTWKSEFGAKKLPDLKPDRIACIFFGRLIKIFIATRIFWNLKIEAWNNYGIELSELKVMKLLAINNRYWYEIFVLGIITINDWMIELRKALFRYARKETKKKPSPLQILTVWSLN